ncbi:MAG: hypothetical protein KC933_11175 [Myxococcales bacterium]|nr:hypothetical protein [Myxococcales bacterium]
MLLLLFLAVGSALLFSRPAAAQDLSSFLANSPGPLTKGHADLDDPKKCEKCHELGGGATPRRCLDCHEDLDKLIKANKGLHGRFGDKKCTDCHTDHKGRAASITEWDDKLVGGRRTFEHDKAGFPLVGVHEKVACTKCHLKKLKSLRTSYLGLKDTCFGCHGDVHRFTSKDLRGQCEDCHGKDGGKAKKMTSKDLPFDHLERSGLALVGKHGEADCMKCHEGGDMSLRKRSCNNCHAKDTPHGRTFRKSKCADCHSPKTWKDTTFNHDEHFPLRSKHAQANCSKCHKTLAKKPPKNCASCHKRTHKDRFDDFKCATCHGLGGMRSVQRFDHAENAKWALTGKHQGQDCRKCHRGNRPWRFEKFESGATCMGCHVHENAHNKEFDDKRCQECHVEGGSRDLAFDHDKDTRFPLTGLHIPLREQGKCDKCHPDQKFRTGKLECRQCHEDSHKGELGEGCDRCHTTEVKFPDLKSQFDHNRLSAFTLTDKHTQVECAKCHPDRTYKTGKSRCVECHKDDDPHAEKLGAECEKCHIPDKGAPKFEHSMTGFLLTGVHMKTDCARCHQEKPATPPKVGWTKQVPLQKLDLHFPQMGKACAECHFDVHEGRYGEACDTCHETSSFQKAAPVHDTGAFRLLGRHDELPCGRCHTDGRLLTGLLSQCVECHLADDVHNNTLGPACGECHQQFGWTPARFNHATTGFVLRGVHRLAQCRDCHGVGTYTGLPQVCEACHQGDAFRSQDPLHGSEMQVECERCHQETGFIPARQYHPWRVLKGAHVVARCSSCHVGGAYAGTPTDCIACHEGNYIDPRNNPNHVLEGYSVECTECHTEITFKGAQPPR